MEDQEYAQAYGKVATFGRMIERAAHLQIHERECIGFVYPMRAPTRPSSPPLVWRHLDGGMIWDN